MSNENNLKVIIVENSKIFITREFRGAKDDFLKKDKNRMFKEYFNDRYEDFCVLNEIS